MYVHQKPGVARSTREKIVTLLSRSFWCRRGGKQNKLAGMATTATYPGEDGEAGNVKGNV